MSTHSTLHAGPTSPAETVSRTWIETVTELPRSGLFEAVSVHPDTGMRLVSRPCTSENLAIEQVREQVAAWERLIGADAPAAPAPAPRLSPAELLIRAIGGGR